MAMPPHVQDINYYQPPDEAPSGPSSGLCLPGAAGMPEALPRPDLGASPFAATAGVVVPPPSPPLGMQAPAAAHGRSHSAALPASRLGIAPSSELRAGHAPGAAGGGEGGPRDLQDFSLLPLPNLQPGPAAPAHAHSSSTLAQTSLLSAASDGGSALARSSHLSAPTWAMSHVLLSHTHRGSTGSGPPSGTCTPARLSFMTPSLPRAVPVPPEDQITAVSVGGHK